MPDFEAGNSHDGVDCMSFYTQRGFRHSTRLQTASFIEVSSLAFETQGYVHHFALLLNPACHLFHALQPVLEKMLSECLSL